MPEPWVYREPTSQPPHPPTQAARAQAAAWRPQPYSQTAHLQQIAPRLPEPPRPPRPSFNPQQQAARRPQPDRYVQPHYYAPPAYAPPAYAPPAYAPPPQQWQQPAPRRKRRVFLWVFLAIQVLFIVLVITQVAAHPPGPTAAQQAAQQCAGDGWKVLFKSQADCQVHYGHALNEATDIGKGIGAGLIVIFWVVVDFFLGVGYGIYRLASRR